MMLQGTIVNRKRFQKNSFGKRAYWLLLEVEIKNGAVEILNTTNDKIPTVGDYVVAHGKYNRSKFGQEFKSTKCVFLDPQEPTYILNRIRDDFELSDTVKKIVSSSKFEKLVGKLKKDIWQGIEAQTIPDDMCKEAKITSDVIQELQREYAKFKNVVSVIDTAIAEIIELFSKYEIVIDEKAAKKIALALGKDATKHIVEDITNLCGLIDIDVILEFGKKIKANKELRKQAQFLSDLFTTCRDRHHLCFRHSQPEDSEDSDYDEDQQKVIDELIAKNRIIRYDEFLYPIPPKYGSMYADDDSVDDEDDEEMIPLLPKLGNYDLDRIVATNIAHLITETTTKFDEELINEISETIVEKENLCKEQQDVIKLFPKTNFLIVTGQPGTGKTRVIRGLARFCKMTSASFHIMSPTGAATRRIRDVMDDLASIKPSTLHSYLYSREKVPYDVLIIDEASMMDALVLYQLIISKLYKKLVLIGDVNQLPPPGLGQCFKELMKVDQIPRVVLKTTFRFDEKTKGIKIALERILKGKTNITEIGNGVEVYSKKSKIFSIAKKFKKYDPDKIRIITSTNKVVNELLPDLREIFNPDLLIEEDDYNFYPDDVVMQTKNTKVNISETDFVQIYNGDFLTVLEEKTIKDRESVQIDGKTVTKTITSKGYMLNHYGKEIFVTKTKTMKLGYCSTCHKAQGSEADTCIIYLPYETQINTRNLLYTAVSRAKKRAIIIASEAVLEACIKTKEPVRYSCMAKMIEEELERKMNRILELPACENIEETPFAEESPASEEHPVPDEPLVVKEPDTLLIEYRPDQ